MASPSESDEEIASDNESTGSESDERSDVETDCQSPVGVPCKFYNSRGGCRDGARCSYLHVCKYALKGNCRNGSNCKLKHDRAGSASSGASNRASVRSASSDEEERTDPKLTDGRFYQWQLNDGNGWMDIDNDHVIEAQYSLPHTKSIKIYNTPYGAVSIDFNRIRVCGKSLKVRRLDDGKTVWNWYCTLRRKWIKYGDKDSKGNTSPVTSSDIERNFQSDPKGSFTFSVGAETLEIRFKEKRQVGKSRKRRVTRRPVYRQQQAVAAGVSQAASAVRTLSVGTRPKWQFKGDNGGWHEFKHRRGTPFECSVDSKDIEKTYQQNPSGTLSFTVKGDTYKLDFGAMMQTNLKNNHTRKIRRLMV
ncbi:uncharacterized protein si:ch211-244b2.4 [Morone saxatilis]|uniref:uncharacterized protein si:ch211-244b2.4 n=1 Tax=Morone saxatilis TaxID=34816 RepID=UPI0015E23FC6|nr:uncharacterized protein si:ch211-244b2.4 [Morone saxatilis]